MKLVKYEYLATIGMMPCAAPNETMFLPPTTTTVAAPGFSGMTSAANVVVVIRMQVNENS